MEARTTHVRMVVYLIFIYLSIICMKYCPFFLLDQNGVDSLNQTYEWCGFQFYGIYVIVKLPRQETAKWTLSLYQAATCLTIFEEEALYYVFCPRIQQTHTTLLMLIFKLESNTDLPTVKHTLKSMVTNRNLVGGNKNFLNPLQKKVLKANLILYKQETVFSEIKRNSANVGIAGD